MKELLARIDAVKKSSTGKLIEKRGAEFKAKGNESSTEIFKEMCFCLLTANFNAERAVKIQEEIGNGFLTLSEAQLAAELKRLGYRHPNVRAGYIVKAREYASTIREIVNAEPDDRKLREWIADNVLGLGYKEASHFLRNIGRVNVAIVDFHIVDLLRDCCLIQAPKTITRKKYLEIERVLDGIAAGAGLSLGQLDLYLWYLETGKVLK